MGNAKQVIVMRTDLNMRKGKMVSQGCHASLGGVLKLMINGYEVDDSLKEGTLGYISTKKLRIPIGGYLDSWLNGIFTKITVGVNSLEELDMLYNKALEANIPCCKITDSGKTEFGGVPTVTCISIGPYWSEEIDLITSELKLL
jgi:PTH2 family peptidyl-tRNA hydrolase